MCGPSDAYGTVGREKGSSRRKRGRTRGRAKEVEANDKNEQNNNDIFTPSTTTTTTRITTERKKERMNELRGVKRE
jgi:hypothetical protein